MASSLTAVTTFLVAVLLSPAISATQPQSISSDLLGILPLPSPPASKPGGASGGQSPTFLSKLQSSLDQIQKVSTVISTFSSTPLTGDLRLSSAVSDCIDLLDLSSDELSWTISTSGTANTAAASNSGTGDHHSDLRSWLSAALGNQDTCKESLSFTGSLLTSLVSSGLDTVTSLLSEGIRMLPASAAASGGGGGSGRRLMGSFPKWLSAVDRRMLQDSAVTPDLTVAMDGTGDFSTVSEAVDAAPKENAQRFVIYVKRGVYVENVDIKKRKWNLMIVGDGINATIISGSRNFVDGWTTFRSATFAVAGKGFIARDITFENTAGASKHQAVALRSDSDLSVFYRCGIRGFQDSLYAHSLRQFYRDCAISGTIDYMFGNAAAVFQNCHIISRLPLPQQKNTITAQGRMDPNQNTGFVLQFCNITADTDLANALATKLASTETFLGRPWKEYSKTVILQSYMDGLIRPEGWLPWNGDFALTSLYYAEYMNYGPGSGVTGRVKWPGYHVIDNSTQASNFTVAQFIEGNLWLPSTGVKYTAGLLI